MGFQSEKPGINKASRTHAEQSLIRRYKMKKTVSLLLAVLMIASVLAGCGSAAQTPTGTPPATPGTSGTAPTPGTSEKVGD